VPILERAGEQIYYDVGGPKDGKPILLGHSLLCDGRMWDRVVPALTKRHRVLNVDFRGHRHSSARAPYSFDDLVDDWLAILDAEKIDRAALVGLSMGGMTAMRVALKAPARVSAMVILDSSAAAEPWKQRVQYRIMAETLVRLGPVKPLIGRAMSLLVGATSRREQPAIVRELTARADEQDPLGLYHAGRAVFRRKTIEPELGKIRAPTLVLCGTEDVATTPERNQRIAAGIPGTALVMLPKVGHLSALEAPDAVAREIIGHLDRCGW
jgi:3-oxoadipate enol-lactonase